MNRGLHFRKLLLVAMLNVGSLPPTMSSNAISSVSMEGNESSAATILVPGSRVGDTADTPIPATFFGMYVGVHSSFATTQVLPPIVVGAVGKGVVTAWMYTETSRGVYAWGALDKVVGFAKTHNAPVFQSHSYQPQWAVSDTSNCFGSAISGINKCPAAPSDLTTITACEGPLAGVSTTDCMWKEYLTTMVRRYTTTGIQTGCTTSNPQCHGVIQMYEGWNEPRGPHPMSLANFITLETDFLNTVKANDPGAQVCSPAFIIDPSYPSYAIFMNDFFAKGGPKRFDCYDFHTNAPTPEAQIENIQQFKNRLSRNGIDPSSATLYATEAGRWGGCDVAISSMSEQAYIGRVELLYWSNGIKRHYWYAYDTCGTLTNQPARQSLNPAGIGYGTVEKWMIGATMSSPCTANGTEWTCGLTRPGGYQALAVWNTAATSTIVPPSQYTDYQDLEGKTHAISGSVNIGSEPVLLISYGAARHKK